MKALDPVSRGASAPRSWRGRRALEVFGRRLAFVIENLSLGLLLLLLLAFFVVRADADALAFELGRFWTHYAAADLPQRRPVAAWLAAALALASALCGWVRLASARRAWRQAEGPTP